MKHIARLVHIAMPATVVMAFLYAPAADVHGETGRLLFFHVPLAWIAALAFAVAGAFSIAHLADRKGRFAHLDARARHSASVGLAATVLATATGSVWAKMSWGSYWNWDPRETSIVILMLIYIAYFSLDSCAGGKGKPRTRRLGLPDHGHGGDAVFPRHLPAPLRDAPPAVREPGNRHRNADHAPGFDRRAHAPVPSPLFLEKQDLCDRT